MNRTASGWQELARRVTEDAVVLRFLLAKGLDPNLRGDGGETLLHVASRMESPDSLRLLLAYGANPNAADDRGKTPLHGGYHHALNVRLLLESGARADVACADGSTPLQLACADGVLPTVRHLVAAGADSDRLDAAGSGYPAAPARAAGGAP